MLNTEARTVEADVLSRRCVMMRLVDFSYEQYQKALRQSAGAVVIILPRSISSVPQDVVRVNTKVFFPFPREACWRKVRSLRGWRLLLERTTNRILILKLLPLCFGC